jgi:hypothetical protein
MPGRSLLGSLTAAAAVLALSTAVPASASTLAVDGFSPGHGPVGTVVEVDGSGFTAGATVEFHGVPAAFPHVNAAGTRIRAAVPPLATTGRITVRLHSGASALSPSAFRVTFGADRSPRYLFGGQRMRISGSAYPPGARIAFTIDGSLHLAGATADGDGNFSVLRMIPAEVPPGRSQVLTVTCPSVTCASTTLPFGVFSNWPQERFESSQGANNTDEWTITLAKAPKLHFRNQFVAAQPVSSTTVEAGGRLFTAFGLQGVLANNHSSILTTFQTAESVTGLAVVGGVLYTVSRDQLAAYDATGQTNCAGSQGRTCDPLWTASLDAGYPFAPVIADGKVFIGEFGPARIDAFDAAGVQGCSGAPTVCTPQWSRQIAYVAGAPAVSALSGGGTGRVYVAGQRGGADRIVAYDEAGTFLFQSPPLPGTVVGQPAVGGGHVVESTFGSSTALVTSMAPASLNIQWTSTSLDGSSAPSAPALSPAGVFVTNSGGRTLVFAPGGCGSPTCNSVWRTAQLGAGGSIAPIVGNGVLFVAADADSNGLDRVFAFDAAGNVGCGGAPIVCAPVFTYAGQSTGRDHVVGSPGGMAVAGGRVIASGGGSYDEFGL